MERMFGIISVIYNYSLGSKAIITPLKNIFVRKRNKKENVLYL